MTDPNAGPGGRPADDEWRAAAEEALAVLSAALSWNLPAPLWDQVREAIAGMAAVVTAGSPAGLWLANEHLDLYGPLRTSTRLGDPPVRAPRAIREQIAELVDALALSTDSRSDSGSPPG